MNCPIHLGAIVLEREKAVSIPCGHVFCLTCITTYFDRKSRRSCPCPICKKPFTKTQMVQLFMVTRSPSSSPAKSKGGSHHLSAMQKDQARILRQDLQNLDASSSVENVTEACEKMDRFVESMAGVTDIETKCLVDEVKAAATRFQELILPELKELTTIRDQVETLTEDINALKSKLQRKEEELDVQCRKRLTAEKDLANLKVSKKIVDDKASGLRQQLDIVSEKLKVAEEAVRDKDKQIESNGDDLKRYKKWAADSKNIADTHKARIKELEKHIFEFDQVAHAASSIRKPNINSLCDMAVVHDDLDDRDDAEPPMKRRRVEQLTLTDMKLDKSCFIPKPQPSFKLAPPKKIEQRARDPGTFGLKLTKNGQPTAPVTLGSRQRMGKLC